MYVQLDGEDSVEMYLGGVIKGETEAMLRKKEDRLKKESLREREKEREEIKMRQTVKTEGCSS